MFEFLDDDESGYISFDELDEAASIAVFGKHGYDKGGE